jgi:hypothetical protein
MPAMWPMRYGGAYLLAWLTARHIDELRPRGAWVLFFVGGVVVINNLEFGLGAFLATVAAVLCARPPRSRRAALRLAGGVTGGALGAIAVVSVSTSLRAGKRVDFAMLQEWPRIFTDLGWFSLPMPTAGLHLALYATFVAAIAVAAVRRVRDSDGVVLTGMLVWSGVFGLVAGSYFVGRSDDLKLQSLFSAWGLALALLGVVTIRALSANGWRRPAPAQLLVLFGMALAICSIGLAAPPHEQVSRLARSTPEPVYRPTAKLSIAGRTTPGERVAILVPMGYRIAHELGLENVSPYGIQNAIVTRPQMETLIDAVRRERVEKIFLPEPGEQLAFEGDTAPEQLQMLVRAGYRVSSSQYGIVELRRIG